MVNLWLPKFNYSNHGFFVLFVVKQWLIFVRDVYLMLSITTWEFSPCRFPFSASSPGVSLITVSLNSSVLEPSIKDLQPKMLTFLSFFQRCDSLPGLPSLAIYLALSWTKEAVNWREVIRKKVAPTFNIALMNGQFNAKYRVWPEENRVINL